MESGLLAASLPQPIDDCLQVLSTLMLEGNKVTPVMASSWQPMDILGKSSGNDSKKVGCTLSKPYVHSMQAHAPTRPTSARSLLPLEGSNLCGCICNWNRHGKLPMTL